MKADAVTVKGTVGGGYNVTDIYTRTAAGATATSTEIGDKVVSCKVIRIRWHQFVLCSVRLLLKLAPICRKTEKNMMITVLE